jgi:ABC-type branched-subunit amino acid transport system ATPase component
MSPPLLVAAHVVAGYRPGLPIVHDVSLDVAAGEVVTIVGPNGAGKSTFLKALAGLTILEGGTIALDAAPVAGLPAHDLVRAGIGFVPQTGNVFAGLSIQENLVAGGHTLARAALRRGLERVYARFPVLAERRALPGRVLSGGQRQMLAIGRALMTDPRLLMLDEPTAGLAPRVVAEVFEDLRRFAEDGVAVLLVEQNAKAALAMSDRAYVLVQGRNYLQGAAADLLADPAVGRAFLGLGEAEPLLERPLAAGGRA